ncbi:CPBP family intramembrane metalloprotease [Planctomycetota bacterium]|nr:CPBP family intramembrane metalloprotease [Planctomycetota bacterium]
MAKNKVIFWAILALVLLIPIPSLGTLSGMIWFPDETIGKVLFMASKVWILLLPLLWHLKVDKEKLSWSPVKKGGLLPGAVLGVLISVVIFVVYYTFGSKLIDPEHVKTMAAKIQLDSKLIYLVGALYWITINSILEEYVWRWFVFRKFEILFGGIAAIFLSAFAFTIHHFIALTLYFNLGLNLLCCLGIGIGGLTWSWLYLKYRSVWPGYISHAIVDVAVFAIGYVLFFVA